MTELITQLVKSSTKPKVPSILSDISIKLLLATITSIAGVYYYEWGYCRYFLIPREFISIELKNYAFLIFITVATYFVIINIIELQFLSTFRNLQKRNNKIDGIIGIIVCVLFLLYVIQKLFQYIHYIELIPITIALLSCLFFTLIHSTYKHLTTDDNYNINQDIWIYIIKNYISIDIAHYLILLSTICILLFGIGNYNAANQNKFHIKNDNKTVLIKKYGDMLIYGEIRKIKNSDKNTVVANQYVYSPNYTDTLKVIKINY